MKKTAIRLIFCFLALVNLAGCVPLIIGAAAGGLGAYAISKDTIQGETDKSFESVWDAAVQVSRIRGTIKKQDPRQGLIEFQDQASYVWVRVIRLTKTTMRLKISSRKHHLPNLSLAEEVFIKIMDEANE